MRFGASQRSRFVVLCAVLTTALFVLASPVSSERREGALLEQARTFNDVGGDHPFFDEIEWLAAGGIAAGYTDGTFRPRGVVTRQAMVAYLHRYAGLPLPESTDPKPPFADVQDDHPFAAAIIWASELGIMNGYSDDTFRPTAPVSRQAMAALLFRLRDVHPRTTPPQVGSFGDVLPEHLFFDEIEWLAASDVGHGFSDGTFRPTDAMTRQAAAAMLSRYDTRFGRHLEAALVDGVLTVDAFGCRFDGVGGFVTLIVFPAELGRWSYIEDIIDAAIARPADADGFVRHEFEPIITGVELRVEAHCSTESELHTTQFSYPDVDVENPGSGLGALEVTGTFTGAHVHLDVSGCGFLPNPTAYLTVIAVPAGAAFPPASPEMTMGSLFDEQVAWPGEATVSFAANGATELDVHAVCHSATGGFGDVLVYPVLRLVSDGTAGPTMTGYVHDGEVHITVTGCRFGSGGGYLFLFASYVGLPFPDHDHIGYEAFLKLPASGTLTVDYPIEAGPDINVTATCSPMIEPGIGSWSYSPIVIENTAS